MKKVLTILMIAVSFVILSNVTQAQTNAEQAIYLRGGYSWFTGVVGVEYQYGHFGFGGGWMPTKTPLTGTRVHAYGLCATLYSGLPYENSYYISGGYIINGYQIENSYGSYNSENILGIMAGHKWGSDYFDIKGGLSTSARVRDC